MSFRTEEKLYIKSENLIQFKEFLAKKSVKKIHHPRIIESLYFDNLNLDMHNDSIEGLVPRKKIRIRNYPQDNDKKIYLEIKNSSVEGRFKTRKIIDLNDFEKYKSLGIFDNQYGVCHPKLYVKYIREYSILNDVRISIDKEIEYIDFNTNFKFNDNKIIVELKTSINKNLDELREDYPMQRIRFSKYCFGVQSLYNYN
jgi:SPX domain protein involved in polyphosphate accumulation|tara:strand:- start:11862 stop:12458 length:597 start_codon:yes stop_codon:yes gene_type:complete